MQVDSPIFDPDGEPTLDARLGGAIRLLDPLGLEVAVVFNGWLPCLPDVWDALVVADWFSARGDAGICSPPAVPRESL